MLGVKRRHTWGSPFSEWATLAFTTSGDAFRRSLLALALGSGCGADDDGTSSVAARRFCDLATQMDDLALAIGASSAPGVYDGAPEAIDRLVAQMGGGIEELQRTAPPQVDDDVKLVLGRLQAARGGDASAVEDPSFRKASQRISEYRQRTCVSIGGEGDL